MKTKFYARKQMQSNKTHENCYQESFKTILRHSFTCSSFVYIFFCKFVATPCYASLGYLTLDIQLFPSLVM